MRLGCAMCGKDRVTKRSVLDSFEWGNYDPPVFLNARIDVYSCPDCEFEYCDGEADQIRHEAVEKHLGKKINNDGTFKE